MELRKAEMTDLESWLSMIQLMKDNFPGLDDGMESYKETVIKNIKRGTTLCVTENNQLVGVMLYSVKSNSLSFLAVHPDHRKSGVASMMIHKLLEIMSGDIQLSTFREGDDKAIAPRKLYKKFGFEPGELTIEFDYPHQKFYLRRTYEENTCGKKE